jgi:hypothetical protein
MQRTEPELERSATEQLAKEKRPRDREAAHSRKTDGHSIVDTRSIFAFIR